MKVTKEHTSRSLKIGEQVHFQGLPFCIYIYIYTKAVCLPQYQYTHIIYIYMLYYCCTFIMPAASCRGHLDNPALLVGTHCPNILPKLLGINIYIYYIIRDIYIVYNNEIHDIYIYIYICIYTHTYLAFAHPSAQSRLS